MPWLSVSPFSLFFRLKASLFFRQDLFIFVLFVFSAYKLVSYLTGNIFLYRFSFLLSPAELFPDSQVHASKKVAEHRAEQSMTNPDAPWDSYDHLVALAARIYHMRAVDRHLVELPERAIEIFKVLWPEEAVSVNLTLISDRLKDACRRFREWKCSAARAGADAALRIACSWYEDLDLDAFHSIRGDAPTDTDPVLSAKRQDRAYRIAEFAQTHTFVPPPSGVRDEISDDEEDAEDEEDEEAAEGSAPPEQGDAPPEASKAGTQPPVA
jgi:hypothetical protein